ncbi:MAG: hypothetical protein ACIARR_09880 [Phycisphaerales bacterium JB059]
MRRTGRIAVVMVGVALALGGCRSAEGPASVDLEPGAYARAFDETRDLLLARQFTLERVDARAGVITTQPKPTAGLATPWDTEQSSLGQEVEDLMNQQERQVRVVFAPASDASAPEPTPGPADAPVDLRDAAGPLVARFEVSLLRVSVPGARIEPSVISLSSRTVDPALRERGVGPRDRIAIAQDPELSARLADDLRQRLRSAP